MQLAYMPITPLVRGMMMHWQSEEVEFSSTGIEKCEISHCRDNQAALGFPPSEAAPPPCRSSGLPRGMMQPNRSEKAEAAYAKYESKDMNGRVWGMPSAFGRGQCLDCPNKAAPPSVRCKECQVTASWSMPMPVEDLQSLQSAFNVLLQARANPECPHRSDHEAIHQSLEKLYEKLHAGTIPQQIQAKLMSLARAISSGHATNAKKCIAEIATQHWDREHKQWLLSVKKLVSSL
jgi:hypothetical protein